MKDTSASWLSVRALLQSDQLHSYLLLKPKGKVMVTAEVPVIYCFHTLPPPRLQGYAACHAGSFQAMCWGVFICFLFIIREAYGHMYPS